MQRQSAIASGGLEGGGGGGGLGGRPWSEAKDTDHRDGVSLFFFFARARAGGRAAGRGTSEEGYLTTCDGYGVGALREGGEGRHPWNGASSVPLQAGASRRRSTVSRLCEP